MGSFKNIKLMDLQAQKITFLAPRLFCTTNIKTLSYPIKIIKAIYYGSEK